MSRKKLLDVAFLAFEAVMHVYLVIYLLWIGANIPVILFTAFELTMFVKLLFSNKKELNKVPCTWHETCCKEAPQTEKPTGISHIEHYRYCNCLSDSAVCCDERCNCGEEK